MNKDFRLYPLQRLQALDCLGANENAHVNLDAVKKIVQDYRQAVGRIALGLEVVEASEGTITFLGIPEPDGMVKIEFPGAPAFFCETLADALEIAIKIEGAKDGSG